MHRSAGLNDEEEVTLKALSAFTPKGQDVPLDRARVGYPYLLEKLVARGFVTLNGGLCALTRAGRVEQARLAAI